MFSAISIEETLLPKYFSSRPFSNASVCRWFGDQGIVTICLSLCFITSEKSAEMFDSRGQDQTANNIGKKTEVCFLVCWVGILSFSQELPGACAIIIDARLLSRSNKYLSAKGLFTFLIKNQT